MYMLCTLHFNMNKSNRNQINRCVVVGSKPRKLDELSGSQRCQFEMGAGKTIQTSYLFKLKLPVNAL